MAQGLQTIATGKDIRFQGELVGHEMVVEEMDRKDEYGREECLLGMDHRSHIDHPAGKEIRKFLGKPEHEPGAANGGHPPEDGKEIKFLPVGPTVKLRHLTLSEKPLEHANDILKILKVREQGVGTEETLQRSPKLSLREQELQGKPQGVEKQAAEDKGGNPVKETGPVCSAPDVDEDLGPRGVVILDGESRHDQGKE